MAILEIRGLSKSFGGLRAVSEVSMDIEAGRITGVIGPNGAGKTTLFNLVTGFIKADQGTVHLDGRDVSRFPPYKIARAGLTRSFQLVRIFPRMTLLDNIMMGFNNYAGDSLTAALVGSRRMRRDYDAKREEARAMLAYLGLTEYTDHLANDLSYGQQKLVEIGRALVSNPKVLLLDEPLAGLNVAMIEKTIHLLNDLRQREKTVVIIEHNIDAIMRLSDWIHVLDLGELCASGTPREILANERVLSSYLGKSM